MEDDLTIGTGARTVGQLAEELSIPIDDLTKYLKRMSVRVADGMTLNELHAEQVRRFVRRGLEVVAELDRLVPTIAADRPRLKEVIERHERTLHTLALVQGVSPGTDIQGRPFILVSVYEDVDGSPQVPRVIEGYGVIVILGTGIATACRGGG